MNEIHLKNCPLCGNEALLKVTEDGVFIECTTCICRTKPLIDAPNSNTAVYATIDMWNRRKGDDERRN